MAANVVISVSLQPDQVAFLDQQRQAGIGRSETIRAALAAYVKQERGASDLIQQAVLVVSYPTHQSRQTRTLIEGIENYTQTVYHHHQDGACMDLISLRGPERDLHQIRRRFDTQIEGASCELVVVPGPRPTQQDA